MVTDHAHLIALDRFTGDLLWETPMADWKPELRRDVGAARRRQPGRVRDLRRRRRRPRLPRRLRPRHRQGGVALLDRPGPRRTAGRDVARHRRSRARLRRHLAHRHLRPRSADALLADRQPLPRLRRQPAPGRQPVFQHHPRARTGDRAAEVALPVHAARPVGLGRAAAAGPRRHDLGRQPAQAAAARQPQRLLLRARSHQRRAPAGQAVRHEADLGPRDRRRRDDRC